MSTSKIRCATGVNTRPTLILLYFNSIVDNERSTVWCFVDDKSYKEIRGAEDQEQLQKGLNTIFDWDDRWQVSFNSSKCQHLSITQKIKTLIHSYISSNKIAMFCQGIFARPLLISIRPPKQNCYTGITRPTLKIRSIGRRKIIIIIYRN